MCCLSVCLASGQEWLKNIEKHTSQPVNKILIGNKADLQVSPTPSLRSSMQAVSLSVSSKGPPGPEYPFVSLSLHICTTTGPQFPALAQSL